MMGGTFTPMTWNNLGGTRRGILVCSCWLLLALGMPVARGQEEPNADELKPRPETLITKDNFRIAATYWPSNLKQDAGVVVLLHGLNGTQLDWKTLPMQLQKDGFAVIAVDLRGHGQSKGANDDVDAKAAKGKSKSPKSGKATVDASSLRARDYEAMVLFDMEAVKQFIFSEHQKKKLNMNKTAIIGAGMGAAVALRHAAVDWLKKPHADGPAGTGTPRGQDIRALVLLTPDSEIVGLQLPDAIKTVRAPLFQVAMMFGVGAKDKLDKGQTKKVFDQAFALEKAALDKDEKHPVRIYLQEYPTPNRGTDLLGKGLNVEVNISVFLKKHVTDIRSDWRDRESKVGKKKSS